MVLTEVTLSSSFAPRTRNPDSQWQYFDLKDEFIRNEAYVGDRRRFPCLGCDGELGGACSLQEC